MRSCSALYIDAGYLLASAATRVSGTSLRASVRFDHEQLVTRLVEQVENDSQLPLMRVNWYDSGNGSSGSPDPDQVKLGLMPRVKLRLGRRSYSGEQKGVDLRLGLDLVRQARNRAIDIAYLLSGDDDLSEAVGEAQDHGVQVIVLAVPSAQDTPHAVARHLQMEADGVVLIDAATIDQTVTRLPRSEQAQRLVGDDQAAAAMRAISSAGPAETGEETGPGAPGGAGKPPAPAHPTPAVLGKLRSNGTASPGRAAASNGTSHGTRGQARAAEKASLVYSTTRYADDVVVSDLYSSRRADGTPALHDADTESIDAVCRSVLAGWLESASDDDLHRLRANRPSIPSEVDRALLRDLSMRINVYEIVEEDRYALRAHFWSVADQTISAPDAAPQATS